MLLLGPPGTGKSQLARWIHENSKRKERGFVVVDCSALTETLFASELFGHVKGAFTGAINKKTGLLLLASGGTIFLDEIGELPKALQAKLLQVLQERVIRPVGSEREIQIDVRVVVATNKDASAFRPDLWGRLNQIRIELPALAELGDDILDLADELLELEADDMGIPLRLEPAARDWIRNYAWPGNVRQLQGALGYGATMHDEGLVLLSDLRWHVSHDPVDALATMEEESPRVRTDGSRGEGGRWMTRTEAAQALGVHPQTITRWAAKGWIRTKGRTRGKLFFIPLSLRL